MVFSLPQTPRNPQDWIWFGEALAGLEILFSSFRLCRVVILPEVPHDLVRGLYLATHVMPTYKFRAQGGQFFEGVCPPARVVGGLLAAVADTRSGEMRADRVRVPSHWFYQANAVLLSESSCFTLQSIYFFVNKCVVLVETMVSV